MPRITVNGESLEAAPATTVLECARAAGITSRLCAMIRAWSRLGDAGSAWSKSTGKSGR